MVPHRRQPLLHPHIRMLIRENQKRKAEKYQREEDSVTDSSAFLQDFKKIGISKYVAFVVDPERYPSLVHSLGSNSSRVILHQY